ncbi:hypothetical protein YC2023_106434 [Brassica napus]
MDITGRSGVIDMAKNQEHDQLVEDKVLWKAKGDTYKPRFRTKETWNPSTGSSHHWRFNGIEVYGLLMQFLVTFCIWRAVHNRPEACDRMGKWNAGFSTVCGFWQDPV